MVPPSNNSIDGAFELIDDDTTSQKMPISKPPGTVSLSPMPIESNRPYSNKFNKPPAKSLAKPLTKSPLNVSSNIETFTTNIDDDSQNSKEMLSQLTFKILVIFFVIFLVFYFWSESIQKLLRDKLYGGKEISWKTYALYATVLSILLFLILYHFVSS